MSDYYKVLDVPMESSEGEIKRAYRKRALELHPDKHPGKPEMTKKFQFLVEAYTVLMDRKRRKEYDEQLGARIMKQRRFEAMSEKRRKLASDLKEREDEALRQKDAERLARQKLDLEILRFRKEMEVDARTTRPDALPKEWPKVTRASTKRNKALDCTVEVRFEASGVNGAQISASTRFKELFSRFGAVEEVVLNSEKSYALVMFETEDGAKRALASVAPVNGISVIVPGTHTRAEAIGWELERDDDQYERFKEYERETMKRIENLPH